MYINNILNLVIFDTYTKRDEKYVDLEEVHKPFRFIFFYKREYKRLHDILLSKYNNFKTTKITKTELLDFCLESDEIQEIIYKNLHNKEEIDTLYEDEINILCNNNMKKSKYFNQNLYYVS